MQLNFILYGFYLLVLVLCVFTGAMNLRMMRGPLRVFYLYMASVFTTELAALMAERYKGSNTQIYNAGDMVQCTFLLIYFSKALKRRWIGTFLPVGMLCWGIYNYYWIQYDALVNSYFILAYGTVVMGLSIYHVVALYQRENAIRPVLMAEFWICISLLFYWSCNLLALLVFNRMVESNLDHAILMNVIQLVSNIMTLLLILAIFLRLKRLIQ